MYYMRVRVRIQTRAHTQSVAYILFYKKCSQKTKKFMRWKKYPQFFSDGWPNVQARRECIWYILWYVHAGRTIVDANEWQAVAGSREQTSWSNAVSGKPAGRWMVVEKISGGCGEK